MTVIDGIDEAVMLLRGDTGERLEPMGVMGGPFFDSPFLHGVGHHVRHLDIQRLTLFDGAHELLVRG